MGEWPVVSLGDVADCLDTSRRPVRSADRQPGPYPYYGASGIIDHVDAFLFDGTYTLVAEDGENLRSRKTPIAFLARGRFWVNNHAHILAGTSRTDVRFLAYRLQHSDVAGYLTGSTQPKLTQQALLSMKFPWPAIDEQRTIASLLGAIDDKIDANQRTCGIAEALATRLLESAISRTHVSEIADIQRSIIDPASSGTIKVDHFSLPAFDEGRLPIRQPGEEIKSGKLHVGDVSVLVSRLNPHIPRVWYAVPENGVLGVASTEFVVMTPRREVSAEELWACCNSTDFTSSLVESVTGTTGSHQRVHQTDVTSIEIGDPRSLEQAERQSVTALVKVAVLLRKESVVLARLRDTILPTLLSGEFHILQSDPLLELPE